jgi:hypothetical protein
MGIGQVLLIIAAVLAALVVAAALGVGATWGLMRRRIRVAPGHRSPAPSRWIASPERAARLHRRLRAASSQARLAAARPGTELAALARDLGAEAASVERDLVVAARAHRSARRHLLAEPEKRVAQVERAASALAAAARANAVSNRAIGAHHDALRDIEERAAVLRDAALDVETAQWAPLHRVPGPALPTPPVPVATGPADPAVVIVDEDEGPGPRGGEHRRER